MRECTKNFLNLFFKEGETICVSHNDYGYHSVSQDSLNGTIEQISPREDREPEYINETDICLMAINPINGFRRDENVTAYRSFMVEIDDGNLEEQMKYIKESGLPYSACIFSGNKSLHFGIVLTEDLPSEVIWRDIAEWILNILDKADPMTKNPTRSIRFPNNYRPNGKKQLQALIEISGRVSLEELAVWLNKYPNKNPAEIRKFQKPSQAVTVDKVPLWVLNKLKYGIDESKGRNNEWFSIAMELAKAGFSDEEMIAKTQQFFTPDRDFGTREWQTILKQAYKRALRKGT